MFYVLSKVVFFFVTPSNIIWIVMSVALLALWRGRVRSAGRLVVAALALMLVLGFSPLGNWLLYPLEQRFERPTSEVADPSRLGRFAGIILLGGFENGRVTTARGTIALNEAAERLTETVRLARALPDVRVVYAGGAARLLLAEDDAAAAIASYMVALGVDRSRIVVDDRSRTTWENAWFLHEVLKPRAGERYLLVTSAAHMPRSIGTFRKVGFEVEAWPADYITAGGADLVRPMPTLLVGLKRVDAAVKEWIGLVGYFASGRSSALWPAPVAGKP